MKIESLFRSPLTCSFTALIMLLFATGCKKSASEPAANVFPDGVKIAGSILKRL